MIITKKDPAIARKAWRERVHNHYGNWHTFFAILPVRVGERSVAFLHTVQRRIKPDQLHMVLDYGLKHERFEYRTFKRALVEASGADISTPGGYG